MDSFILMVAGILIAIAAFSCGNIYGAITAANMIDSEYSCLKKDS